MHEIFIYTNSTKYNFTNNEHSVLLIFTVSVLLCGKLMTANLNLSKSQFFSTPKFSLYLYYIDILTIGLISGNKIYGFVI